MSTGEETRPRLSGDVVNRLDRQYHQLDEDGDARTIEDKLNELLDAIEDARNDEVPQNQTRSTDDDGQSADTDGGVLSRLLG